MDDPSPPVEVWRERSRRNLHKDQRLSSGTFDGSSKSDWWIAIRVDHVSDANLVDQGVNPYYGAVVRYAYYENTSEGIREGTDGLDESMTIAYFALELHNFTLAILNETGDSLTRR